MFRKALSSSVKVACMGLLLSSCGHSHNDGSGGSSVVTPPLSPQDALATATPIKHLVVIFGENESFDHYFGTYPQAANPSGEPTEKWVAPSNVANVNGYVRNALAADRQPQHHQRGQSRQGGFGGLPASFMNPFRLDRAQFDTSSQNHAYTPEQLGTDNLKMDAFVANTGKPPTRRVLPAPSARSRR